MCVRVERWGCARWLRVDSALIARAFVRVRTRTCLYVRVRSCSHLCLFGRPRVHICVRTRQRICVRRALPQATTLNKTLQSHDMILIPHPAKTGGGDVFSTLADHCTKHARHARRVFALCLPRLCAVLAASLRCACCVLCCRVLLRSPAHARTRRGAARLLYKRPRQGRPPVRSVLRRRAGLLGAAARDHGPLGPVRELPTGMRVVLRGVVCTACGAWRA